MKVVLFVGINFLGLYRVIPRFLNSWLQIQPVTINGEIIFRWILIFGGLSEQGKKSRKLERTTNNDFSVIESNVIITLLSRRVCSHDHSKKRVW